MKLVEEFKRALKERVDDSDLRYMYEKLFFGFLMPESELNSILKHYNSEYEKYPEDWFAVFHKAIRQTDFFDGGYIRYENKLTEQERKRRNEILQIRMNSRRSNPDQDPPHQKELQNLNSMMHFQEEVPVAGLMDGFLHSIICLDKKGELKNAMEVAFKICN